MIDKDIEIIVPENIFENWQEIVNILAQIVHVPAALIMRIQDTDIEVFVSSKSKGNPLSLKCQRSCRI